ncbi:MAG: TolC family protein [Armatimonadetes bacterium]|nr:TolC family protein [Armatimonadota bacterium]
MKRTILAMLTFTMCVAASATWAATTPPDLSKPITVDQSLEIAFQHNPDIKIALDQIQKSKGVVNETRANFNPKFSAQATYLRQPALEATFPGSGDQGPQNITIQSPQNTTIGTSTTLPLDINKRLTYTSDIARLQFDIQYLNMVSVSERVIVSVKSAYYDLLRASGQALVAQAAVDVADVRLANTKSRFEAGTVPKFDVTTAEVDLANLNQQLIQAQNRVELARSTFNRTLGIDINSPTQVVESVPPATLTKVDVPASTVTAYTQRPEVKAARAAIDLNHRNVKLQQTGRLPSLSVNTATTYQLETTTFNTSNVFWQATLNFSVPIWDGGITSARVQQARADVQNSQDTLDQTKLGVGQEVRNAALNVEEAAKRIQTTSGAVSLAEEALRLANVRYEAGIAVLVEVTNAESQLTQAKFNYVNAQYDYATALAQLQRATSTQPELSQLQLLTSPAARKVK